MNRPTFDPAVQAVQPTLSSCHKEAGLAAMLEMIQCLVIEGCQHGFFEMSVQVEMIRDRKRQVIIKAGISHKFTIPAEELDRKPLKQ